MKKKTDDDLLYKFMALPAILLFLVFFLYPLCREIYYSMTDYNGIAAAKFIGLKNFIDFFHDSRAVQDIWNTLQFGFVSALALNVFGLIYALIFQNDTRFNRIARTVVYIPAVISGLIMGYIWLMILSPQTGSFYQMLSSFHLQNLYKDYLGSMKNAMWVIIAVNVWQFVGAPMIIYLAGLQAIGEDIYEASMIDGANYFQKLFRITIPLLIPSIRINVITNLIYSLAVFDVIVALTNGGPGFATESLSQFIYRNAYGGSTGYATAVAIIMFFIILIPVVISLTIINKKEVEM